MTENLLQLIEAAARERFNDGAALVLRAALKVTEGEQKTLAEARSGTSSSFCERALSYWLDIKSLLQLPTYLYRLRMIVR